MGWRAAPTIFYHPVRDVRVVVHCDDFTFPWIRSRVEETHKKMREWYDVKINVGGHSDGRMTG